MEEINLNELTMDHALELLGNEYKATLVEPGKAVSNVNAIL